MWEVEARWSIESMVGEEGGRRRTQVKPPRKDGKVLKSSIQE